MAYCKKLEKFSLPASSANSHLDKISIMKTIGLLGGMSWESTSTYYRLLNEGIKHRLGGLHSARLCLFSVDFSEIEELQHKGDWDATAEILSRAAQQVQAGGAEFLLIGTNTMHKVADQVADSIDIPLLHIADATAEKLKQNGVQTIGLLGTRFTMQQDFYKGRLTQLHGIEVLVPDEKEQEEIHRVIYDELCLGKVEHDSRDYFLQAMERLVQQGAQGIILGCTEIAMLVRATDTDIPLYDTTEIHCAAAIDHALNTP
jgi:aspartate racemase